MKYKDLINDILNILRSEDNDLELKMYDISGNNTVNPSNAKWCYIHNRNLMVELPDDNCSEVTLWKDSENLPEKFQKISQRIRVISVLNGCTLQTKVFNKLNQRKIYNLVKQAIESNAIKEEESKMNESVMNVSKGLKSIVDMSCTVKKPSDFYLSESFRNSNIQSILKQVKFAINASNVFDSDAKAFISENLIPQDLESIVENVSVFERSNKDSFKNISENLGMLKGIQDYIKQAYLKNAFPSNYDGTIEYLGECRIVKSVVNRDEKNLTDAYNHLLSVSSNAKSGTDILRCIKKENLCEKYNVSKDDLIDMWLNVPALNEAETRYNYTLESLNNDKVTFIGENCLSALRFIAEHINNGGKASDDMVKDFICESQNNSELVSTIASLKDSKNMTPKLAKCFKMAIKESLQNIESIKAGKGKLERKNISTFFEKNLLEGMFGSKPCMEDIAYNLALLNLEERNYMLTESRRKIEILSEGFSKVVKNSTAKELSESLIKEKITVNGKQFSKITDENCNVFVKNTYNNVISANEKLVETINDTLFTMMMNPSKIKSKVQFLNVLNENIMK